MTQEWWNSRKARSAFGGAALFVGSVVGARYVGQDRLTEQIREAAARGDVRIVRKMIWLGANRTARVDALEAAARFGHKQVVTALMEKGVDIRAREDCALQA